MTFNGGTVLFSDEVLQDESKINRLIVNILTHQDTKIEVIRVKTSRVTTGIFKITLNEKFSNHFKSNPTQNINAPSVLIIKLFIGYPDNEVTNEIAIQKALGSQNNVLPICPSFLFAEKIKTPGKEMTMLGILFYRLI